ncbi:hypothetical protein [Paenibacillus macquariensis]|nr:hypothetical protein [Paenibacillus macquariensis]MEC0093162.1 hypothetical protein [Paenibacillus macquariensis]
MTHIDEQVLRYPALFIILPWKNEITSIICGAALALHAWLTGRIV